MLVAATVVSLLFAALVVFAAVRKIGHREPVVQSYLRVGVPRDKLNYLAVILLTGAAGLIAGLLWAPVGLAAAAGLVCYFGLAVAAHIRADDAKNLPTPVIMLALAIACLVLRLAAL
jgi:DoxX-like family